MSYPLNIQKADRYRLEFLKNGGVYADFDTIILDISTECTLKIVKMSEITI